MGLFTPQNYELLTSSLKQKVTLKFDCGENLRQQSLMHFFPHLKFIIFYINYRYGIKTLLSHDPKSSDIFGWDYRA